MRKLFENQLFKRIYSVIQPWLTVAVILVFLKLTGLLNGVSVLTNTALLSTGIMDADPEANRKDELFDYNFQIKDLKGNKVDISEFKNKVIFLNMWATWCGPCRAEMPAIQKLYDSVANEKIVFVMLSLDKDEHQPKIVSYIKDKEFRFPVYQPTGYLPKQLQVPSIPTTLIISPDGKIKMKKVGTANYNTEKFRKFLLELAASAKV
jgi:thiol-disulfide isomerase/thioredoxin